MAPEADKTTPVWNNGQLVCDLYRDHRFRIVAFFRRYSHCSDIAEDLAQEVFVRVWEKNEQYRPGTPGLVYLYGFANIVLREYRAKRQTEPAMDVDRLLDAIIDDAQWSPQDHADIREQTGMLLRLIADLPEKQARALELTCLKGLSNQEASVILACSTITIRRNRHIAVATIQAWLRAGE